MDDSSAPKETEHELRSLLRLSDKLNSASDLDSLLDSLVEQLFELTGAESGCAGLRTSQGMSCDHFFLGPTLVPLTYHCAPGVGWAGWLIQHGTHYLTNDAAHDAVMVPEVRERLGVKSGIAVPIFDSEKDVIAFFEIYNKKGGQRIHGCGSRSLPCGRADRVARHSQSAAQPEPVGTGRV